MPSAANPATPADDAATACAGAPVASSPGAAQAPSAVAHAPAGVAHAPAAVRTASYEALPGEVSRVLLLYSGGLDTSVMLKWIQDHYDAEVVTLTVDLGQPGEDYGAIRAKAEQLGALECLVVDAREEFAHAYVAPAIRANALYGGGPGAGGAGGYPLFTALGRPLIGKLAVEHARRLGCDAVAHGCTGKGNDQVRIEGTVATLAPELKVIAPVRTWRMGRDEEVAYARAHGIPIGGAASEGPAPYSIDDNLWGRSSEGRWIEDLEHAPEQDVFALVTPPERAPDEPEIVELAFERGLPVAIGGEELGLVPLIERATEIGARNGVGIVDHLEDRIVGLKVRDIYEVPAATIILAAHSELERLTGTIHQNQLKPDLERRWAYLVYAGLWWEPLRADLDVYMHAANERVTGTVALKLYKGAARVVTRSSPNAVYDSALASFAASGDLFAQGAAPGFIELHTLQSRMAWRLHERHREGESE
jgi:argininosuccinate synthase